MDTLHPQQQAPTEHKETVYSDEDIKLPPLKHVEFLAELGLKDEMFNTETMEKVEFLAENLNGEQLEELSLRFPEDKLNRIFTYVQLSLSEDNMERKLSLIKEQKCQMQRQSVT